MLSVASCAVANGRDVIVVVVTKESGVEVVASVVVVLVDSVVEVVGLSVVVVPAGFSAIFWPPQPAINNKSKMLKPKRAARAGMLLSRMICSMDIIIIAILTEAPASPKIYISGYR
jgi:hypothetical protein